ncbi:hypothetical protein SynA1524_01148 [Synechococcus sp. A15-24]|nr:hypothetical protein SynA1524_01148 [Synechococcus sp. A15-24]
MLTGQCRTTHHCCISSQCYQSILQGLKELLSQNWSDAES